MISEYILFGVDRPGKFLGTIGFLIDSSNTKFSRKDQGLERT